MAKSTDQVIVDLIEAGIIDAGDVLEANPNKERDQVVEADANGTLNGGDGDDTYLGKDGQEETFFFDGRHDNNDEGRHVNVVQNFSFEEDTLRFRLDGGFFKDEDGTKIEQSTNGNQAAFDTARDFADLMLHLNSLGGEQEEIAAAEVADNTAANGKVDGSYRKSLKSETTQGSFVSVVDGHIVMNFDDGSGNGETVDKWGNFVTNDVMIVFENFEKKLAAQFANELGYSAEFASAQDSVHIAPVTGGTLEGGDGDNLFIMSNGIDKVKFQRGFNNNDESKHVNIVHGFDLAEDKLTFDSDFNGLFTIGATTGNGKFATFEGADGIAALLATVSTVSNVDDSTGDLHFDIQLKGGDPMTVVLTNTTLDDVYSTAAESVWEALVDSGAFAAGEVPPPVKNQDNIIFDTNGSGKGDDILIATAAADTFNFQSGSGREDGTGGTNDGDAHVKVIIGFNTDDEMSFRIDGGFFADSIFKTINNNQGKVTYDQIDEFADFLNSKGGDNGAIYDAETNSTILTLADTGATSDGFHIVLWDSGDLF